MIVGPTLKAGWLMRTCHEAHIACMADHSPSFFRHLPVPGPANAVEEQEIFERMNTRFKAWTGKSIAEYLTLTAAERHGG